MGKKQKISNIELFIAKRIHFSNNPEDGRRVSRPAVRIATAGIAIGLAVMIVAVAILVGFKQEIRNKIVGFGSHIQLTNLDSNSTYETQPIVADSTLIADLQEIPIIQHVQRFATKPGMIKTDNEFEAVILKGVDANFDWDFFEANMLEGKPLELKDSTASNGIIISKTIAQSLKLKLGDSFVTYFIQDRVRARKFTIEGIYETNFSEYDKIFALADIRHIQRLNGWEDDEVSGLEILLESYEQLEEAYQEVYYVAGNRIDRNNSLFSIQTIRELRPAIFDWLDLLDANVWIILIVMLAVAGFNMISGLLIIILERTNMIGILKSMGCPNKSIRNIFLYQAIFLIGKGMLWGNIIGLGFCLIQHFTGIVSLPKDLYLTEVPISLNVFVVLLLNIATFIVSVLMLIAPSYLITKINPARSIRFE